ncbi:uncharacterized protein LOC124929155 [Impatiens glandulifera]|uniref:uncharacterized protein LOC124929155 n=1 Tax=Impatiens glandulifera TaxID=253017 RepID=UPI001FB0CDCA|nr:uncharacterized protein LOC124929155 [Impatiens glandulifera]
MNKIRVSSSPELHPPPSHTQRFDDSSLQGIAANVKLLLKLIEDHKEACSKEQNDGRRMLRVAGMMTILENIRSRIQHCMSSCKKRDAVLRRSNSDLHRSIQLTRDKKPSNNETPDDRDKLKRDLDSSLAARKGLEAMCFSLGKEKKIMADELTKKAQELNEMEEFVNDMRAQNDALLARVRDSNSSNTGSGGGGDHQMQTGNNHWALQERNKTLSEQLQRLLAGYKSAKRRLQESEIENGSVNATMDQMAMEMKEGRLRIQGLRERIATERNVEGEGERASFDVEEEISGLEHMFLSFETKLSRNGKRKANNGA